MIVRTYGRRSRGISRPSCSSDTLNDAVHDDSFKDSLTQESPLDDSLGLYSGFAFSSQDSSSLHWASDSDPYAPSSSPALNDSVHEAARRPKKPKRVGRKREPDLIKNCTRSSISIPATSTLMEAQEFGEMMEHVDEVNFALDGLRKGLPVRIRRASLLSLLSICATAQQRRLLRTQGYANFEISVTGFKLNAIFMRIFL